MASLKPLDHSLWIQKFRIRSLLFDLCWPISSATNGTLKWSWILSFRVNQKALTFVLKIQFWTQVLQMWHNVVWWQWPEYAIYITEKNWSMMVLPILETWNTNYCFQYHGNPDDDTTSSSSSEEDDDSEPMNDDLPTYAAPSNNDDHPSGDTSQPSSSQTEPMDEDEIEPGWTVVRTRRRK